MNRTYRLLGASVVLLGAAHASAQSPGRPDTISKASSFALRYDSVGQNALRLVSSRYLFARVYRPDTTRGVVLHETAQQSCCIRGERDTWGTFAIEAWPDSASGRTPLWKATVDADEGEVRGGFYRTITFGCCDSPDQLVFFDLLSGGPAFFATTGRQDEQRSRDISSVRDDESRQLRFVAFQEADAVQPSQHVTLTHEAVGVLQYGPSRGASSRIAVQRAAGDGKDYFLTDVRFMIAGKLQPAGEATLFPPKQGKRAGFSGFVIRLRITTYDAPVAVITIPVEGDSPVLSRATVPRGFTLRALPSG